MKRLLALALFAAASLAHAHGYAVGELKIDHPWARATPGAAKNGAAYLTVSNTGKQADRLVAASVDVADHAELHTHLNDNGVMKMRQIPDIPVEAGATVKLQPGGLHIMLMDLKQPLKEGDKIPLTLRFEKAGEVKVDVHVDKVGAMPAAAGAHAGH